MNRGWRDRARPWLLGLAMAVGAGTAVVSTPACDGNVTLAEGCHAICACVAFLPSQQQACEFNCQTTSNPPTQDCLRCASDAESCSVVNSQCIDVCRVESPPVP